VALKPTCGKPSEPARLDAGKWSRAALELLAEEGIDGVRVETLAKRLGVTKGSIYWHFKDRDALLQTMLTDWRRHATLAIIDRLEQTGEPPERRLRQLLHLPLAGGRSKRGADVELSVRLWGRTDPRARAALEEIDQLRLRYIGRLLEECGISATEAPARAILAYSYMRVAASLIGPDRPDHKDLAAQCEAILLRP
jgi:AcrR family transcriptional regulator